MTTPSKIPRCCNLDWLEVYASEPCGSPRDAAYFRSKGFVVHEREYGTRIYREMFTIDGQDGFPLLEIRRNPFSSGSIGVLRPEDCHIRLTNRTCYFDGIAAELQSFLDTHGYFFNRISRIDICLDFEKFDRGDDPATFIRRYFQHRYAKVNQGRITGHGQDGWHGQEWNSVSWGSRTSCVTTKIYNKTLELKNPKDGTFKKPYIRQAWMLCGLIDDMQRVTRQGQEVQIWRVEFSLQSSVKGWVPIELDGKNKNYQSLRNTLQMYSSRAQLLVMFASLANHYFRFKKFEEGKRKDRCEDKVLFKWEQNQTTYKIENRNLIAAPANSTSSIDARLLRLLLAYQAKTISPEIQKACNMIIAKLERNAKLGDAPHPWNTEELEAMRLLMHYRTEDPTISWEFGMVLVKKAMGINDNTLTIPPSF